MITKTTIVAETHGIRLWAKPVTTDARVSTQRRYVPMVGGLDVDNSTGVSARHIQAAGSG